MRRATRSTASAWKTSAGAAVRVPVAKCTNLTNALKEIKAAGIFVIGLIGSSVLTEEVFARPGLGKLMVGASKQRDYTLLQAIMVLYAFIIIVVNIVVDIIYTVVDPRVRYD